MWATVFLYPKYWFHPSVVLCLMKIVVVHFCGTLLKDMWGFIVCLTLQWECCGAFGADDWNLNIYFNCTDSNPSREKCGVPFSCCTKDPAVCLPPKTLAKSNFFIYMPQNHRSQVCLKGIKNQYSMWQPLLELWIRQEKNFPCKVDLQFGQSRWQNCRLSVTLMEICDLVGPPPLHHESVERGEGEGNKPREREKDWGWDPKTSGKRHQQPRERERS